MDGHGGDWHKRKSEIFKQLVMSGAMPGRPGVRRLAQEAHDEGLDARRLFDVGAGLGAGGARHGDGQGHCRRRFAGVFAGDIVKAKKPAPDIYNYAADTLGLSHRDCVVVEDSRNGLQAATAAGMKCVITTNGLTEREDFSEARAGRGQPRRSRRACTRRREPLAGAARRRLVTVATSRAIVPRR